MKIKIGIIPTFSMKHNYLKYSYDQNLLNFITKLYKNSSLVFLTVKKKLKLDIIISSGGNDLIKYSKKKVDKKRSELEKFYLKYAIKKNIKFLGICYGAQFIANELGSEFLFDKKHVGGKHLIFSNQKKKNYVNSFHNYKVIKLGDQLESLYKAEDESHEAFKHKNKKILGIMWHPERFSKLRNFDKKFIEKYL